MFYNLDAYIYNQIKMPIVPSVVLGVKCFGRPLQGASYTNHEIWGGFLCWVWKGWQIFFPYRMTERKKILVSHALVESLHLPIERWNLYPLPQRLSGPLRLLSGTECGGSNVAGFLKWDQTRWLGFLLALSHLRHETLEPLCEKSDHTVIPEPPCQKDQRERKRKRES